MTTELELCPVGQIAPSSLRQIKSNMAGPSRGWRRAGRHYVLLLWKNIILAKRMPIRTFLEITLPVFFGFLLLGIRRIVKSETVSNNTFYPTFTIDQLPDFTLTLPITMVAYAPRNNFTNAIMQRAGKELSLNPLPYDSEDALVEDVNKGMPVTGILGGVIFTNLNDTSNITYKIRLSAKPRNSGTSGLLNGENNWRTNLIYPIFPLIGPRNRKNDTGGTPGYYQEGFLTLQRALDLSIINQLNSSFDSTKINITLQRYPFPPFKADNFVLVIQIWFPFLLIMSYIFAAINTVKNIVYEKERGLKVAMTIMGLNSWIHWAAWFTRTLIFLTIADILIAICYIIKIPLTDGGKSSVIGESDISLLFFFLFSYSITSICFMFFISTLFDKANSAAAGTGGLWFVSYLPYAFIQPRYETMTRAAKMGTCLLHNIGLALGAQLIGMYEGKGTGLQWSMINEPVSVDDNFTMANVITMFYIDAVIYLLLALYIENIWPGEYGIPKSVLYPFKLSYWRGYTTMPTTATVDESTNGHRHDNGNLALEEEPRDKELGVRLTDVSKTYTFLFGSRPPVHAVRNLSMNVYNGQLTALLGHNGAGKSTTISMITGLIPPTSGQIIVHGFDIATSMDSVRDILGLCPQYNILFDYLTVREHLRLFATLKGHPSNDIDQEIGRMVEDLLLTDKLDTLSSALSGGMKRKLSVGIALIANSKVVILDEPTSGMDPAARRSTWEMLQRFRTDRTILFTTHFMDEADILGDRIAIMGEGRMRCFGSPFFLKTKYGVGYHLILTKEGYSDPNSILQLVLKYVNQAQLESAISAECKILLPHGSSAKFPELFEDLERQKDALQIFSIGLSETSIEEVFMKIVEKDEADDKLTASNFNLNNGSNLDDDHADATPIETLRSMPNKEEVISSSSRTVKPFSGVFETDIPKNHGTNLWFQQFRALMLKRILNSMRNYLVLFAALLPVIFVIISLVIEQQIPKPENSPPLMITLDRYKPMNLPYSYNGTEPFAVDFIHSYAHVAQRASKPVQLIDLEDNTTRPCQPGGPVDILSYLACIGGRSLLELSDQYLIGTNVSMSSSGGVLGINSLFNNQPYHVPPLTLNQVSNTLLRQYSPSILANRSINVINHPLPRSLQQTVVDFQSQQFFGFRLASSIVFGFGFMMASFAVFLIKERVSKAKHLQFLSGADAITYWLSSFLWDAFYYAIASLLIFLVWTIFYHTNEVKDDIGVYLTGNRLGYTILLFTLYGCAHIPMTYLLSYIFQIPASGFAWITIINIITSQATLLAVVILSIPQLELLNVARILDWIFLILFPNYCLGQGLSDIYRNHALLEYCPLLVQDCPSGRPNPCCKNNCGTECVDWTYNYLDWQRPGVARFMTFMAIQCIFCFTILLLLDFGMFSKLGFFIRRSFGRRKSYAHLNEETVENNPNGTISAVIPRTARAHSDDRISTTLEEDEDVRQEAQRIQETPINTLMETDVLILNQVSKIYNGKFRAVDQLSLGIKKQECFGLLGVNGAGKTSTFKMITGDETVDSGWIVLDNLNLSEHMQTSQRKMGYCPQFDALIDLLTGEETLYMFARLRGVKEGMIPGLVIDIIELMNLTKHAKKPVYAYSGGNKRKLSTAVGLIGDPSIVFLDEPTTGMDPKARRYFWNAIAKFRDYGKPIILTSHSMEECEALCTRLAIMVNGKFKCLGSIQHLKSKFGAGYTFLAKLNVFNENRVNEFFGIIKQSFPNSQLKEAYEGFVHIHIVEANISLAALFRTIESCKQKYSIENYTVSQTTLEQVFLNFAKSQLDPDEMKQRVRTEYTWRQRLHRFWCQCT